MNWTAARVSTLAALAIGVSILAVWQGTRQCEEPGSPAASEAEAGGGKPEARAPRGEAAVEAANERELEALRTFIAQLDSMLVPRPAARDDSAGEDQAEEPMPLPLPEHLQSASKQEQHAYYVELLRHGEGMIELNREHMSEKDLAEAEEVMAKLRKRLDERFDAGVH